MTIKQRNFVDEYIINGGNGAAAARKAGYAECTAKARSSRLLRRDDVRQTIDTRLDELQSEKIVTQAEILEFLSSVLRGEVKETIVTPGGKKFVIPVRCAERLRAAENLCKIYGMFKRDEEENKNSGAELLISTLSKIGEKIPEKFDDEKQSA